MILLRLVDSIPNIGPIEVDGPFYVIAHAVTCEVLCRCSEPASGSYAPESGSYDPIGCASVEADNGIDESAANTFDEPELTIKLRAYPVPFNKEVTLSYKIEYDTDVQLTVHDTKGLLVYSETMRNYRKNTDIEQNLNLSNRGDQMFYVTLTTSKGSVTKKIISSNKKR